LRALGPTTLARAARVPAPAANAATHAAVNAGLERAPQLRAGLAIQDRFERARRGAGRIERCNGVHRGLLVLASRVAREVARDPAQPTRTLGTLVGVGELLPGDDERVLCDLFAARAIAKHRERDRAHRGMSRTRRV